jgi:ribonuclease R
MNSIKERKEKIVEFMAESAYKPLKFEELAVILDVPQEDRELFAGVLRELEEEGSIYKTNKDRYGLPGRMNLVVGRIQGNERGYGFLIPDDEEVRDVFVPADGLAGAMHNDRTVVRITTKGADDRRPEGEVIKILKRANRTIVGTFENSRYFGFVVPDDRRVVGDIFIPKDELNGAKPGFKVVAEIVKWPEKRRNAEGKITEIIGDSRDPGTDILSIIKAYDLKESFPEEAVRQAEAIPEKVEPKNVRGRRDLRKLRMVTIDGEDAKDLDDAVSVEKLPNGNYRLGVHIADVSAYVTEGSPLDEEALKRGTSVYLVDRVIPMLPARLSNGICSLNPHVDRLAFTVMMELDSNGKAVDHEIFESVINIDERMTYTNVYKLLETDGEELDEELTERYSYLMPDFILMKELALILRKKRMSRGAIDFDFDEAKIILDDKGKPVEVKRYETTIANRIIEEFMLVCNETVAEHFHWAGVPFVFRVHEEPDAEKIMAFAEFSSNLGYHLKGLNKIHPRALQDILDKVKGSKQETIVSTVMLRSLAKARYSHQNLGHFGLAAEFYCHFTSPIRRYPDLIIHRLMKESLKNGLPDEREQDLLRRLPEIARLCSERERAAEEAERETEDLKKVEYMKQHVGEVYDGIIANVTSFGMFVELDNTIEGLVKVSNMDDDYYVFDDKHYCLLGEKTRKRYSIGDEIKVRLARADMASRQIDFTIEEERRRAGGKAAEAGKKAAGAGRGKRSPDRAASGGGAKQERKAGKGAAGRAKPERVSGGAERGKPAGRTAHGKAAADGSGMGKPSGKPADKAPSKEWERLDDQNAGRKKYRVKSGNSSRKGKEAGVKSGASYGNSYGNSLDGNGTRTGEYEGRGKKEGKWNKDNKGTRDNRDNKESKDIKESKKDNGSRADRDFRKGRNGGKAKNGKNGKYEKRGITPLTPIKPELLDVRGVKAGTAKPEEPTELR